VQTEQNRRVGLTGREIDRRVAVQLLRQEQQRTLQERERTKNLRWARYRSMLLTLHRLAITDVALYELHGRWTAIEHLIAAAARHIR
jgi:hypothetical protein